MLYMFPYQAAPQAHLTGVLPEEAPREDLQARPITAPQAAYTAAAPVPVQVVHVPAPVPAPAAEEQDAPTRTSTIQTLN